MNPLNNDLRVLTFSGTSPAIKAESLLLKAGIKAAVMPLPPNIRAGCGLALRISGGDLRRTLDELKKNNVETTVYRSVNNNGAEEAKSKSSYAPAEDSE